MFRALENVNSIRHQSVPPLSAGRFCMCACAWWVSPPQHIASIPYTTCLDRIPLSLLLNPDPPPTSDFSPSSSSSTSLSPTSLSEKQTIHPRRLTIGVIVCAVGESEIQESCKAIVKGSGLAQMSPASCAPNLCTKKVSNTFLLGLCAVGVRPHLQYGWDFPEAIREKCWKKPGNALRAFP